MYYFLRLKQRGSELPYWMRLPLKFLLQQQKRVVSQRWLLTKRRGLLAKIGDDSALAIHVQRLLDEPVLRQSLTESALEKCQMFSKDEMVRQTEEWYNKVLNN